MEEDSFSENYSDALNASLQMQVDKDIIEDSHVNKLNNSNVANDSEASKPEVIKFTKLPMARIKSIMKMDPDVSLASTDAVFAITKATEMFIDSIAKEAYAYTAKAKKKIITKKDLDAVIESVDCLCFLEGATDF